MPSAEKRARRQLEQEGNKSFKLPENQSGESKFASLGGPRRRTGSHDVPGSGPTAPLHQKAARTTARPHNSGGEGKADDAHTYIYKENADHQQHHFEKPPFGSQPGGSWSRESVLKPPGRKNAPTKCSTALPPEKHFFQFRGRPVDANLVDFVKNRPYFKRCCLFFRFWSFGLLLLFRSVVWASRFCCACAFGC